MLRVTQAELSRYRREVDAQADKARDYFHRAIAEFMRRYPDATTEDTRVFVLDLMGSALPNFTDLTATLACDLFDEMAEEVGFEGERARLYETTDWQMVDRKVHYLAGFLNEGDRERFKSEVSDLTHYYCKRAAYDNMVANCRGQRVKWARVPTGLETCAFCFMLASRGFAYLSEKSAAEGRHGYHSNCDCVVVPGFEGPDGNPRVKIDGYDPETMYRNWLSCAKTMGINKHADPMSGEWTDDERRAVRREVATRDWHWLYTGEKLPKAETEPGAKPMPKEWQLEEWLRNQGFRLLFRRPTGKERTSDTYFVTGQHESREKVRWEMKQPTGDQNNGIIGKRSIKNQFRSARGQARNLVIDASKILGMVDTEGNRVDESYVIEKTREALLHREESPYFDQALVVFGNGRIQRVVKTRKSNA